MSCKVQLILDWLKSVPCLRASGAKQRAYKNCCLEPRLSQGCDRPYIPAKKFKPLRRTGVSPVLRPILYEAARNNDLIHRSG